MRPRSAASGSWHGLMLGGRGPPIRTMRIALVTRRFDPAGGGTERDLTITARILAHAGHRVTIYAGEVRAPCTECTLRHIAAPRLGRALALLWFARAAGAPARHEG